MLLMIDPYLTRKTPRLYTQKSMNVSSIEVIIYEHIVRILGVLGEYNRFCIRYAVSLAGLIPELLLLYELISIYSSSSSKCRLAPPAPSDKL